MRACANQIAKIMNLPILQTNARKKMDSSNVASGLFNDLLSFIFIKPR